MQWAGPSQFQTNNVCGQDTFSLHLQQTKKQNDLRDPFGTISWMQISQQLVPLPGHDPRVRVVTSHLRSFHRGLMRLRCISAVVGARAKVVKSVLPLVGIAYPSEVEGSLVLLVVVPIAW